MSIRLWAGFVLSVKWSPVSGLWVDVQREDAQPLTWSLTADLVSAA